VSDASLTSVHRMVDAFNRLDIDAMIRELDPEIELREWPLAPGAQTYHGHEGARKALDSWFETWEWMRIEIVDVLEAGDQKVITLHQRAKGRGSEIEVEIKTFNVYTFGVDGKVTRMELFTERDPALEAAGLTPVHEEEKR
jgi:ketosteroid isomerase-like protein